MQGPAKAPPVRARDYLALNVAWAGAVAGLLQASDAEAPRGRDLPVIGLAAFAAAKAVSKERIGTWAREPLVDEDERPKGRGLQRALGELVTCSRCMGTWASVGLVGLNMTRPREGRVVTAILATAGLNDFLQTGFSVACATANRLSTE